MRISLSQFLIVLVALAGVFFLRYYLHVPKAFLISIVISAVLIGIALKYKSGFAQGLSVVLIGAHIVRLIWYLIPVYEKQPDVRLWYRSSPSVLSSLPWNEGDLQVAMEEKGEIYVLTPPLLSKGIGVFNGTHIMTEWGAATDRAIVGFRDGSLLQLFSNTELVVDALRPEFSTLTGSRIATTLRKGTISATTHRSTFNPGLWSVRAGGAVFSCQHCVITYSGDRGSITSASDFMRANLSGDAALLSGGSYTFEGTSVQKISNDSVGVDRLSLTASTSQRHFAEYLRARDLFIAQQFGRKLDTSTLMSYLSKTKMALMGLVDRTYRNAYNRLHLYEYLRGTADFPDVYEKEKFLYEFIQ